MSLIVNCYCIITIIFALLGASFGELNDFKEITFTGYACENVTLDLSCQSDFKIKIVSASYGRKLDDNRCKESNETKSFECPDSANTLETVKTKCDDKLKCSIKSSMEIFQSSCRDGILQVAFKCLLRTYTGISCENKGRLEVSCPKNRLIITKTAKFSNKPLLSDCSPLSTNDKLDVYCAGEIGETFRQSCDKQETCLLNSTYAKNCTDEIKGNYLKVEWACLECRNYYPDDALCEFWANVGECIKNEAWMFLNCRQACWKCKEPVCENKFANSGSCDYWADGGECEKNPAWMMPYCRKSCLKCDNKTAVCEDYNDFCKYWASEGECEKNKEWMSYHCKASCSKCVSLVPECENAHDNEAECEFWANMGECYQNPIFMIVKCFKSCSRCSTNVTCENVYDDKQCKIWAESGECNKNPTWMTPFCRQACNWCNLQPIRIEFLGNPPYPGLTDASIDQTVILSKAFEKAAKIQYFMAFFRNTNLVKIQLWRPFKNDTYQLIYERQVQPIGKDHVQTIVVENCLVAKSGDRIGFSSKDRQETAIGFNFDVAASHESTIFVEDDDRFNTISLPYAFSVSAVVDEKINVCD